MSRNQEVEDAALKYGWIWDENIESFKKYNPILGYRFCGWLWMVTWLKGKGEL